MADHENTDHYRPTEAELEDIHWNVAEQVLRSGKRYDQIFAVARGGLPLAFVLSKALEIQDVQTVRAISYVPNEDGITESPLARPSILLPLPQARSYRGERVLIVDDLIETGGTITEIMPIYPDADTGFDYSKLSAEQTAKVATYCGKLLEKDESGKNVWVDFPYDIRKRELRERVNADRS